MTTLWHQILTKSTLAKALSEVYLSISASKIAHIFINDTLDCSLQIPQISSISELPTAIEPQMPGLWLTTANSFDHDDESVDSNIVLAKHFALLLLDDVENILKDIDHEHGPREVSHPLADFVQTVKPTMSYVSSLIARAGLPSLLSVLHLTIEEGSFKFLKSTPSLFAGSKSSPDISYTGVVHARYHPCINEIRISCLPTLICALYPLRQLPTQHVFQRSSLFRRCSPCSPDIHVRTVL